MPFNAALEGLQDSIISGDTARAAPLVRDKPHFTATAQIAIYSDAYRIRLRQVVVSDYPCLSHHLGDTLLPWIEAYVASTPSQSYNLDLYPQGFWRFLRNTGLPVAMVELAALEGAIAEVFMGPGSAALTPDQLPSDEERLGQMRFTPRAPYRLLSFTHDVESAFVAFKRGAAAQTPEQKPIRLLIHRANHDVQRRVLEDGEYLMLQQIASGASFGAAIQQTLTDTGISEETMAASIMRWLPRWIQQGFFAG